MVDVAVRFSNVSKSYRLGQSASHLQRVGDRLCPRALLGWRNHWRDHGTTFWALRGVTFEVLHGQAMGVVGPNGAGKTTLLKLLARITVPTSGRISVSGRLSALIELGAGFHPELSGRENIFLNAAILGMPLRETKRRFDDVVAFSGLERFIDTPVKRYSSGMYVRLAFSVAAHVDPDILLVDEVLAVGDAEFRQRCAKRIEELRQAGTTVVFVAHNLYLVESVCDTAIFLESGGVRACGAVGDVIRAYEGWMRDCQGNRAQGWVGHEPVTAGVPGIEVSSVEVRRIDGCKPTLLRDHDGVEVRIHYLARQTLHQPNAVLRIVRGDGTTCAMIRLNDYGLRLADLSGQGVISVAVDPIQLATGSYRVNARLLGSVDGVPIAEGSSRWFHVQGRSLGHEEASGVFVPHVEWARADEFTDVDYNSRTPTVGTESDADRP